MAELDRRGNRYASHGVPMIPFYIYYSMFGFQRIGDLAWAAGDMRARGLPDRRHGRADDAERRRAAAPGRPQPPPGRHHPQLHRYDPTFGYEIAVIIQDGLADVSRTQEDVFYYLTVDERELPPPRHA
jgi:pyruvate dehydrogenase E1 component